MEKYYNFKGQINDFQYTKYHGFSFSNSISNNSFSLTGNAFHIKDRLAKFFIENG